MSINVKRCSVPVRAVLINQSKFCFRYEYIQMGRFVDEIVVEFIQRWYSRFRKEVAFKNEESTMGSYNRRDE